jgi:hypothetical protein
MTTSLPADMGSCEATSQNHNYFYYTIFFRSWKGTKKGNNYFPFAANRTGAKCEGNVYHASDLPLGGHTPVPVSWKKEEQELYQKDSPSASSARSPKSLSVRLG